MDYVIKTRGLYKKYGAKNAVNDVSINVARGEIYGLIGKNGAGKTSLMKLILGLTFPTSGELELFGGENLSTARKKIGSLIEDPGLYQNRSAKENLTRFALLYGEDLSKVDEILETVNLSYTGKKPVKAFSQGMKQRLGIAIALLGDPEVLILDEPINGLDPAGIKEIRDTILRLNREKGTTFIISSHLLDELAKVVTTYGIISDGALIEEISANDIAAQSGKHVRIVTDSEKSALNLIKTAYPDVITEMSGNEIKLKNHLADTADINALLVKNGIAVYEIAIAGTDFEQFFINKLGA